MILGLINDLRHGAHICMLPAAFEQVRSVMLSRIDRRVAVDFYNEKKTGSSFMSLSSDGKMVSDYVGNANAIRCRVGLKPEDRVVNVVPLCGPMTRGGDACSYGSMDIRDQIMAAADIPQCRGHIIYCNTPGGMASCLPDIRLAVDYAHQHGQQVYMLIDGLCASGGAFSAAICDKVFCTNLEDEIGSIGMFSAFFTLADGAENKITSEVYHEYYASKSTDKNGWFRKAANGDMSDIERSTNEDLDRLLANLRNDRPSISEDQMTGKMYRCGDVIGSLIDGQSSLSALATELLDAPYQQSSNTPYYTDPSASPEDSKCNPEDNKCNPEEDKCNPEDNKCNPEEDDTKCKPEDNKNMKTFTAIPSVIGEAPIEVLEDGELTLQGGQAEALETFLANVQNNDQQLADARAMIEQLTSDLSAKQSALDETSAALAAANDMVNDLTTKMNEAAVAAQQAIEASEEAHKSVVAELESAHATAIADLESKHATAIADIESQHATAMSEKDSTIASLSQQNADLSATVEELNNAPGAQPNVGASPANNGAQAQPVTYRVSAGSKWNPNLSAEENYRLTHQ